MVHMPWMPWPMALRHHLWMPMHHRILNLKSQSLSLPALAVSKLSRQWVMNISSWLPLKLQNLGSPLICIRLILQLPCSRPQFLCLNSRGKLSPSQSRWCQCSVLTASQRMKTFACCRALIPALHHSSTKKTAVTSIRRSASAGQMG